VLWRRQPIPSPSPGHSGQRSQTPQIYTLKWFVGVEGSQTPADTAKDGHQVSQTSDQLLPWTPVQTPGFQSKPLDVSYEGQDLPRVGPKQNLPMAPATVCLG
jgi:hypothetical protein